MELVSSARKRYIVGIDSSSVKIVGLIVPAIIPTNAEEFPFTTCGSPITDAVNTADCISQSAVTVPKLLEALIRTFFFQST